MADKARLRSPQRRENTTVLYWPPSAAWPIDPTDRAPAEVTRPASPTSAAGRRHRIGTKSTGRPRAQAVRVTRGCRRWATSRSFLGRPRSGRPVAVQAGRHSPAHFRNGSQPGINPPESPESGLAARERSPENWSGQRWSDRPLGSRDLLTALCSSLPRRAVQRARFGPEARPPASSGALWTALCVSAGSVVLAQNPANAGHFSATSAERLGRSRRQPAGRRVGAAPWMAPHAIRCTKSLSGDLRRRFAASTLFSGIPVPPP